MNGDSKLPGIQKCGADYFPPNNTNYCHIEQQDLWIMLLSMVRYSMGRMTYMSSLAGELVIKYEKYLKRGDLSQIAREIEEELLRCAESNNNLGMEMDDKEWRNNAAKIREILEPG